MGLDMYLKATRHISNYYHADKKFFNSISDVFGITKLPKNSNMNISIVILYWRKANSIHHWFVKNCQDGNDDCNEYEVTYEKLRKLFNICTEILKIKGISDKIERTNKLKELLPTYQGCFFGSYDYDEYYFEDIEHTVEELQKILSNPVFNDGEWAFTYQSSW